MITLSVIIAFFTSRARREPAHVKVPCDTCRGVAWDIDLTGRTAVRCPYCGHIGGPRLPPSYNHGRRIYPVNPLKE
jgi:hypothetical protein